MDIDDAIDRLEKRIDDGIDRENALRARADKAEAEVKALRPMLEYFVSRTEGMIALTEQEDRARGLVCRYCYRDDTFGDPHKPDCTVEVVRHNIAIARAALGKDGEK